MAGKRPLLRIKKVQNTKFGWAYVDSVKGKRELVPTGSLFRVQNGQKLPFLPEHQDDFDETAIYVQRTENFCPRNCLKKHQHSFPHYKKVSVKFLGSKYINSSTAFNIYWKVQLTKHRFQALNSMFASN